MPLRRQRRKSFQSRYAYWNTSGGNLKIRNAGRGDD